MVLGQVHGRAGQVRGSVGWAGSLSTPRGKPHAIPLCWPLFSRAFSLSYCAVVCAVLPPSTLATSIVPAPLLSPPFRLLLRSPPSVTGREPAASFVFALATIAILPIRH